MLRARSELKERMDLIKILNIGKERKKSRTQSYSGVLIPLGAKPYPRLFGEEGTTFPEREGMTNIQSRRERNEFGKCQLCSIVESLAKNRLCGRYKNCLH